MTISLYVTFVLVFAFVNKFSLYFSFSLSPMQEWAFPCLMDSIDSPLLDKAPATSIHFKYTPTTFRPQPPPFKTAPNSQNKDEWRKDSACQDQLNSKNEESGITDPHGNNNNNEDGMEKMTSSASSALAHPGMLAVPLFHQLSCCKNCPIFHDMIIEVVNKIWHYQKNVPA